jgi:Leucine-rich repeat (LRR) protein
LAAIGNLKNLVWLGLNETQITDSGLSYVGKLTRLQVLSLNGDNERVTDKGLEAIAGLTNLQVLYLSRCQVTDSGLAWLSQMSRLKSITVTGTILTDEAIHRVLPNCKISR